MAIDGIEVVLTTAHVCGHKKPPTANVFACSGIDVAVSFDELPGATHALNLSRVSTPKFGEGVLLWGYNFGESSTAYFGEGVAIHGNFVTTVVHPRVGVHWTSEPHVAAGEMVYHGFVGVGQSGALALNSCGVAGMVHATHASSVDVQIAALSP